MLLEYTNYAPDFSDNDLDAIFPDISTVILPSYYIKSARTKLKLNTKISCLIDFPLGISDSISRIEACKYAIKNKVNYLDIVMQSSWLANRKYDKIRDEIPYIQELCKDSGVGIRYILEYRAFEHQCLKKVCEILMSYGLDTISLSTGYGVDVLSDFIIATKFLTTNLKINIILTANFWSEKHIDLIIQNNFYGVRSQHIKSLQYLANFLQKPA